MDVVNEAVFDPFNPPPPDEAAERERLSRALHLTDRFAVFFATCNRADQRSSLIQQIQADNPDLHIVTVPVTRANQNLLNDLSALPELSKADAVFVYGLEAFLPHIEEVARSPFVVTLNHARNAFPQVISCPVVFWLADYARIGVMQGAPDFYSIRSAGFHFPSILPPPETIDRLMTESIYTGAQTMRPADRAQHEAELRDLLSQAESLPEDEQDLEWQLGLVDRLAGLYLVSGNYDDAETLLKRSLEMGEKMLGLEHPDTATSLSNLAHLYNLQGNYPDAEPLLKRSLNINEKVMGVGHTSTATSLNNLAYMYASQGHLREAEPLLKRSLNIMEATLGLEHPDTATSLHNLAGLYRLQGDYQSAAALYQRAFYIREKTLGVEHPNTATSLNNLAELYISQGNFQDAEPLLRRALDIREKVLGPEHPNTATSLNNLACLYESQGNYQNAEPLYNRALDISERVLGQEHVQTKAIRANLANLDDMQKARSIQSKHVPGITYPTPNKLPILQLPRRKSGKANK